MIYLDVNFDANKVFDQVQAAIQKYGPTVWEAAIRQAYVDGWSALVWGALLALLAVISLIACVICWRLASKRDREWAPVEEDWQKKNPSKYERPSAYNSTVPGGWAIFFLLAVAALVVAAGAIGFDGAKHLINPTWYALQNLKQ